MTAAVGRPVLVVARRSVPLLALALLLAGERDLFAQGPPPSQSGGPRIDAPKPSHGTTPIAQDEESPLATNTRWRASPHEGVLFEDPDGPRKLHLGGSAALQLIKYDPRNTRDSGVRFDRSVIRLDGTPADSLELRLSFDLKGTDTHGLEEGWLSYTLDPRLRITTGLLRVGLGDEFQREPEDLTFVGWAFPSYLDARSDAGIRVDGEFADSVLYYDLVATAGAGYDTFGQTRKGSQFSARFVSYPLRNLSTAVGPLRPFFSGLFAGAAVAYSPHYRGHLDVATPLRSKIFLTPSLSADSSLFLHYTAGGDFGPLRITYELVNGSLQNLETPAGEESLRKQITAWAGTVSWLITGESYDSRPYRSRSGGNRIRPHRPVWGVPVNDRGGGAWEVAVRFSNADIDRDFFNFGVTNFVQSSQEFRTFAAVLNWYASGNLKTSFEITRTIADQDPAAFDGGGRDTSYVMQLQYRF